MAVAGPKDAEHTGFQNPFEVTGPPDCEGWGEMYASHVLFCEERRAFEESRFWFQDALHAPEPLYPFDAIAVDFAVVAFNQASSRLFAVPSSLGCEYRLVNGYLYFSPNAVTDEETLAQRGELFERRGGYYYDNWDTLYAGWEQRVKAEIGFLEAIVVPALAEFEDESVVTDGHGLGSSHALLLAYNRLLESLDRIWHYHFEFLGLGYGAYLAFYETCRQFFPDIDEATVAGMLTGIDVLVLKPDDELRRLAQLAIDLDLDEAIRAAGTDAELKAALCDSDQGKRWLENYDDTKTPWFDYSSGLAAYYHHHRSWIDDPILPIATIGHYIKRLAAGEDIARPQKELIAERERRTEEYRALVPEPSRTTFDQCLGLAQKVFPFVENHNLYIDHWYFTIFWNKVREFGALLTKHRFLIDPEDIFYLRHDEVRCALDELRLHWSSGGAGSPRGPKHWPTLVERRKPIYQAQTKWAAPPALGTAPTTISDPVATMLWGITTDRIHDWLSTMSDERHLTLTGIPGSPGVAEGPARVILHPDQLGQLQRGEILVAPTTSTSWTPIFGTIAAAVLDTGGIMCHAAIVAREYGLPAVVGTGTATTRIKTGDYLQIDATNGVVRILDEATEVAP